MYRGSDCPFLIDRNGIKKKGLYPSSLIMLGTPELELVALRPKLFKNRNLKTLNMETGLCE